MLAVALQSTNIVNLADLSHRISFSPDTLKCCRFLLMIQNYCDIIYLVVYLFRRGIHDCIFANAFRVDRDTCVN